MSKYCTSYVQKRGVNLQCAIYLSCGSRNTVGLSCQFTRCQVIAVWLISYSFFFISYISVRWFVLLSFIKVFYLHMLLRRFVLFIYHTGVLPSRRFVPFIYHTGVLPSYLIIQAFYLYILLRRFVLFIYHTGVLPSYLLRRFVLFIYQTGVLPFSICSSICSIVINNISIIIFIYDSAWFWHYEAFYFFLSYNNTFASKFDC